MRTVKILNEAGAILAWLHVEGDVRIRERNGVDVTIDDEESSRDANGNENCLCEMQCPACGQAERVRITALSTFVIADDGEEEHDDVQYGDDAKAYCPQCDYAGDVEAFQKAYAKAHGVREETDGG